MLRVHLIYFFHLFTLKKSSVFTTYTYLYLLRPDRVQAQSLCSLVPSDSENCLRKQLFILLSDRETERERGYINLSVLSAVLRSQSQLNPWNAWYVLCSSPVPMQLQLLLLVYSVVFSHKQQTFALCSGYIVTRDMSGGLMLIIINTARSVRSLRRM